jgi:hypothetical protein
MIDQYQGSFDVVHERMVCTGFQDYFGFLRKMAAALKPGGVLLTLEGIMQLHDANLQGNTAMKEDEEVRIVCIPLHHL